MFVMCIVYVHATFDTRNPIVRCINTLFQSISRHRTEHRAGGALKQIVGRPQDKKDPALHSVAQVRRGHDRVQPDADRLPGPLQE